MAIGFLWINKCVRFIRSDKYKIYLKCFNCDKCLIPTKARRESSDLPNLEESLIVKNVISKNNENVIDFEIVPFCSNYF